MKVKIKPDPTPLDTSDLVAIREVLIEVQNRPRIREAVLSKMDLSDEALDILVYKLSVEIEESSP